MRRAPALAHGVATRTLVGVAKAQISTKSLRFSVRCCTVARLWWFPGGRVVYGTCSILLRENEDIIADFLKTHPDFTLVPASSVLPDAATGEFLKLTPAQHDTDGFFGAVLQRDDDFAEPVAAT